MYVGTHTYTIYIHLHTYRQTYIYMYMPDLRNPLFGLPTTRDGVAACKA